MEISFDHSLSNSNWHIMGSHWENEKNDKCFLPWEVNKKKILSSILLNNCKYLAT